jgi:hypothetical protein
MEVAIIWLLSMFAMGEEIKKVDEHNKVLQAYIARVDTDVEILETDLLVLQGAHAALHARTRVDHDNHHEKIDLLIRQVDILNEMSEGESSTTSSNVPDKP